MPNELEGGKGAPAGGDGQVPEIGGASSGDSQGDNLDAFRLPDPPENFNQDNEQFDQAKADGDKGTTQDVEAAATKVSDTKADASDKTDASEKTNLSDKEQKFTDNSVNKPRTPEYLAKHEGTSDPEIASLMNDLRDGMAWHEEKAGVKGLAAYQEKNSVGSMLG